jgi:hypothetical protein
MRITTLALILSNLRTGKKHTNTNLARGVDPVRYATHPSLIGTVLFPAQPWGLRQERLLDKVVVSFLQQSWVSLTMIFPVEALKIAGTEPSNWLLVG